MSKELLKNSLNDLDFNNIINQLVEKSTFYKSKEKASNLSPSFSHNEVIKLLKQTEEGRQLLEIEGDFNCRDFLNKIERDVEFWSDSFLKGFFI